VTFTLFAGGVFGGGDAKMVAAIGVWLGFDQLLPYALIAGVFGGVFALLLMQARAYPWPSMVLKFPFIARLSNEKEGIPYGVALGAAALLLYPESAVWQAAFLA
jgi:prepilin peptidase CpaA